ncbi:MAG: STAS domain-containing protein [Thermodesulfovibrionales bacterium]
MTDVRFKQTGGIVLLDFYGELTVQDAEKLRQAFLASFERSDYVVVNLKNVSSLDTSCFGLFCSA